MQYSSTLLPPPAPPFVHIPIVSGPLFWTFMALFWTGAAATSKYAFVHTLIARIVANIFIWVILLYGMFFITGAYDYAMGFKLSLLSTC